MNSVYFGLGFMTGWFLANAIIMVAIYYKKKLKCLKDSGGEQE